ncbi:MAG: DUF418 domain-containing protein [Pseudomonadota bacterium]
MASPTAETGRIGELDALRGFALLGVFIVHFVGLNYWEMPVDPSIREAWNDSMLHFGAAFASDLFFVDKANTLFATLFGMGFWVMMTRLQSRSDNFERLYLRRLSALFVLGVINLVFLFPLDVLHDYAIVGFALFLLRGLTMRAMLIAGLALTFAADPVLSAIVDVFVGQEEEPTQTTPIAQAYLPWVKLNVLDFIETEFQEGGAFSWWLYILGRFLLGAWVIRAGWLEADPSRTVTITRLCAFGLIVGGASELFSVLIFYGFLDLPAALDIAVHACSAPLIALGYACGVVLVFRSDRFGAVARYFSPVGKIALTAYVAHGAAHLLIFMPFGLDLAGTLGPGFALPVILALFAAIQAAATLWLRHYRFGPLEYVWRWATYGTKPAWRLPAAT